MLSRITSLPRSHAPFFLVVLPLILLMTYPTITYVFDASRFVIPTLYFDVWMKFWDPWLFKLALAGETDFFYTNFLFYPDGASLAYQTWNLPHMIVMNILQLFMPVSNAFCLAFLLIVLTCCAAGYFYCNWLFKDKWLASLGAVIFGLCQHIIGHSAHPDLIFIAPIPMTLYLVHRGIDEGRTRLLAGAGLMLGFTAYCGMYIFVINAMTVALFVLLYATSRLREARFWGGLALMGALAIAVSTGRVLPMLSDQSDLDRAIEVYSGQDVGTDLMGYFFNYRHPILSRLTHAVAGVDKTIAAHKFNYIHDEKLLTYLGLTTFALIGFGLLRRSSRRAMLPWLVIALVFMVLRLGAVLQINGAHFDNILLPKFYLNQLLPTVFGAFHRTTYFQIGVVLPVAVLACFGLRAVLNLIAPKRRLAIVLAVVALIAFETWLFPHVTEVDQRQFDYIHWLKAQDDQESIRLVTLPLHKVIYGTTPFYLLHQIQHGYPVVSGHIPRVPEAAFGYIAANPLLSAARNAKSVVCSASRRQELLAALDQLLDDGFSHIVIHTAERGATPFRAAFANIPPDYSDGFTLIYELSQLRASCEHPPPGTDSLSLYLDLVYGLAIPPPEHAVLTFHPSDRIHEDALRYLSWNSEFGQTLTHVTCDAAEGWQCALQSANPNLQNMDDVVALDTLLYLHDPAVSEGYRDAPWMRGLSTRLQPCQRLAETAHIAIDLYSRRDMPCALVAGFDKLKLVYENGSELRNRVFENDDRELRFSLWWRIPQGPKTSYSIQVFDSAGARARQIDQVMNRSMKSVTIDLSDLPAGEYHARLIVYDFETGKSFGGEVASDATRFQRDIEIAHFTHDG